MNIELNRHSSISLIQQIHESIGDRIRSGQFETGRQLPSIRELSKTLGVSMVTVSKAYTALEKEKLIIRVKGKGTFVQCETTRKPTRKAQKNPYDWHMTITDYLPRTMYFNYLQYLGEYQFSLSKIDPVLLPNQYLQHEVNKVLKENPSILSTYGEVQGDLYLRIELASYLKKLGVDTKSENILITNGVQQGLDLVARTFVGSGDLVVLEAPAYSAAIDVFRSRGGNSFIDSC